METNTRRNFFGKITVMTTLLTGAPRLFAQQAPPAGATTPGNTSMTGGDPPRRPAGNHTLNGIYYFSGTGSNDGYGREDHILVTDPFEKHVTRSLDALKKSLEAGGS